MRKRGRKSERFERERGVRERKRDIERERKRERKKEA